MKLSLGQGTYTQSLSYAMAICNLGEKTGLCVTALPSLYKRCLFVSVVGVGGGEGGGSVLQSSARREGRIESVGCRAAT